MIKDEPTPGAFSFLCLECPTLPTAILIDGAFFVIRFRAIEPHNAFDARRAAEVAWRWAVAHLSPPKSGGKGKGQRQELYRIFFYDCPPLEKKMHNPISGKAIDYAKSEEAKFRKDLHAELLKKRKVALRLGHLSPDTPGTIKQDKINALLRKELEFGELTDGDVRPSFRQKGVDMRVGLDIASLSFKRQVSQIVLMAGDADFVPAAKLARREGIDFVLDPMWRQVPPGLNEHIDGLRSTCPRPKPRNRE